MKELPERFEKEVLSLIYDGWFYNDDECRYMRECNDDDYKENWYTYISKYELAAIGLEAMNGQCRYLEIDNAWIVNKYCGMKLVKIGYDKDFCDCIFKAIREIYKK